MHTFWVYGLISFDTHIPPVTTTTFPLPQNVLNQSPFWPGLDWPIFYPCRVDLFFRSFTKWSPYGRYSFVFGFFHSVCFWDLFMLWGVLVACSFLAAGWYPIIWTHYSCCCFTHSPPAEYSGHFHVGAVNKGAMNVYVQVFGYMIFVCVRKYLRVEL